MRGTRWLLLVVIAALLGGIAVKYRAQKDVIRAEAPPKPEPLPENLNAAADHYDFTKKTAAGRCPVFHVLADNYRQSKDSSHVDLTNVEVQTFNKECTGYNLSRSASAVFFPNDNRLVADGEAQITINVPIEGRPKHTPVSIHTAGVVVDVASGKAETDRPSTFVFENGSGKATGASYDPTTHELNLKSGVEIDWKPDRPGAKAMHIEAASLTYHEDASEILLNPWGRMSRANTVVEGENVGIHLKEIGDEPGAKRVISSVHAIHAHGTDTYPNRKLQYSADDLEIDCDDDGEIRKITGANNAHLVSSAESSETTVNANHVDMDFVVQNKESVLAHVAAGGNAEVDSKPLPVKGRETGETHILRSDSLEMSMRPGGHEIASVVTHAPGTLEFLPNAPAQRHRVLTGSDMQILYGVQNRVASFHATAVKTVTDPNTEERKHNRANSATSSRELTAGFDSAGKMANIEQAGDFAYQEGDRQARAQKGSLDSAQNVILLEGGARMWDATGSTSADRIRMDQRTGDFVAQGNVNSSHMPDKNPQKNSQMLSGDEPLQAKAQKMESKDHNKVIHYEGSVVMWQGANRITAKVVDLDRNQRTLISDGDVVNYLWEQPKDDQKKKGATTPVLTVVKAPHMVYTDSNRLAVYTGGVTLTRPGMNVKCRELQAYMAESGADSRLEKAFANGAVEIIGTSNGHVRTGTAEHSEYYTTNQMVVLRGGPPKLVDTMNGAPKGSIQAPDTLTYYANDDRLLGIGSQKQPVLSRIYRGK